MGGCRGVVVGGTIWYEINGAVASMISLKTFFALRYSIINCHCIFLIIIFIILI